MPNFQQLMGEEIRRLARKELKAVVEPLKTQLALLKKTVAEQNKRIHSLESAKSIPQEKTSAEVAVPEPNKALRITPERITKLRNKLGVSQSQFARLLEVSIHSINRWEAGKNIPRPEQKLRIAAIRDMGRRERMQLFQEKSIPSASGLFPSAQEGKSSVFNPATLTQFRESHQLTKVQLAALLGTSQFSVGHWESGKSVPRVAQQAKISALLESSDEQLQAKLSALPNITDKQKKVSVQ